MMKFQPLVNLPERLRRQADNVETDGWATAARLMREAAFEIEEHRKQLTPLALG